MDTLKINSLINIAKEDLKDDHHFIKCHDVLDKERQTLRNLGYDPEIIVNILYEIWCQRLGYILDNEKDLSERYKSALKDLENFNIDEPHTT